MNMLMRYFIMMTLLKRELKKIKTNETITTLTNEQLFTPFIKSSRVLPHDMGFRNHLPNYRYLSFIELNITAWLTQCQHAKGITEPENKLYWILAMQEMVYLKEIKFLDKMKVTTKLEGWDKKYIYFQHHFSVKNNDMAIGLSKVVLMNKAGKKFKPDVLDMTGNYLTDIIDTWNANQLAIKQQ